MSENGRYAPTPVQISSSSRARWLDRAHIGLLLLIIVPIFTLTARWGIDANADTKATALPAWQLVQKQTLELAGLEAVINEDPEAIGRWYVSAADHELVSNRPPGLILLGIPSYLLFGRTEFSNGPASGVAVLTTTLAMIVCWWLVAPLVGRRFASLAVLVLAFGTTTWWISSSELWPHGPGQLAAALAVLSASSGKYAASGSWFGFAVLLRPITAVSAAVMGTVEALRRRQIRPLILIAVTSGTAVGVLLMYNRWLFGAWSIRGGYPAELRLGRLSWTGYMSNLYEMLLGLPNGVLTTSPIVAVAVLGAVIAWKEIPAWAKSAAVAGAAYLLVHAALNRASGGMPFFYRYPLEALVLATPLLVMGARALWERAFGWVVVVAAAVVSVALQVFHALYASCYFTDPVVWFCVAA